MLITNFIDNLLFALIFYWYGKKLFTQVSSNKTDYVFLIAFVLLKTFAGIFHLTLVNFVFSILTYIGIIYLFFHDTLKKEIFFIILFLISTFLADINSYVLIEISYKFISSYNDILQSLLIIVYNKTILGVLAYLIAKLSNVKRNDDKIHYGYFLSIPTISVFIIYTMMQSNLFDMEPMLSIICRIISCIIVVLNVLISIKFTHVMQSKDRQIKDEEQKSQELHYMLLEEKVESSKKFIHDFKKHINMINAYVYDEDWDKLKVYLNELSTEIKKDESFVLTGNKLIDLCLHANKDALTINTIEIKHDIKIKDVSPVTEFDFNIVFSNILDNAIESCIRTSGHFIKIKLDKTNDLVVLKVINPCLEVKENFETLKDENEHGYGISNIKKIVEKYDGSATFKFDKEQSVFISTIIFNNS